jgi:hypothetical protein
MANPFKEAEKARKKAPGSKQEAVEKKEDVVVAETPAEPEKPVVEEKKVAPATKTEKKPAETKPAVDIFAGLAAEKATGKTYAFYLSDENVNKLKKKAEKMGISASKLLDHILSEVL